MFALASFLALHAVVLGRSVHVGWSSARAEQNGPDAGLIKTGHTQLQAIWANWEDWEYPANPHTA